MIVSATVALLGISYYCMAPLEEAANPNLVPYIAKAPWYFLGIQEMISWSPPWPLGYLGFTAMFFYGVILPSLMIVVLGIVPYFDRDVSTGGVWFHPARKWAISIFTLWITFMGILILVGEYCRGHGWTWALALAHDALMQVSGVWFIELLGVLVFFGLTQQTQKTQQTQRTRNKER